MTRGAARLARAGFLRVPMLRRMLMLLLALALFNASPGAHWHEHDHDHDEVTHQWCAACLVQAEQTAAPGGAVVCAVAPSLLPRVAPLAKNESARRCAPGGATRVRGPPLIA